jgi:DNA-binding transcriptional LysR family regulator
MTYTLKLKTNKVIKNTQVFFNCPNVGKVLDKQSFGTETPRATRNQRKRNNVFDNVAVDTHAAVDGLGIIQMYRPLADPLLEEGKLVVAHDYMAIKKESYYFVCPETYASDKAVSVFRDWTIDESRSSQAMWRQKFL